MTFNPNHLLIVCLIAFAVASCGDNEPQGKLVSEVYVVKSGDTLWSIAETYIVKNTGGRRYMPEFISGIEELNYDSVFNGRKPGELHSGDELKINYWVSD